MDLYGTNQIPIDMKIFSSTSPSRSSLSQQKFDESYTYVSVPCIGRVRFLRDNNGMLSILFVYLYWIYGTCTSLFIVLIPAYDDGHISSVLIYCYLVIAFLCLTSLIRASTLNPGRVHSNDQMQVLEDETWTFCHVCERKRPWRAHHCRRCRQCVLRMDHHCPWINNCVGEENHYAFMLLLFYSFLLGLMSFIICMLHFWILPKCVSCDREVFYIKHGIWFMYLLTLLGLNMALVMGVQFLGQHFNLLIDRTTLQNMKGMPEEDSVKLRGMSAAYKELFGRNAMICWFLPCRGRKYQHYSTTHPV